MSAPSENAPLLNDDAEARSLREGALPASQRKAMVVAKVSISLMLVGAAVGGALLLFLRTALPPQSPSPTNPLPGGQKGHTKKRNLIMMVSDGFGPASEVFGRTMACELGPLCNPSKKPDQKRVGAGWWGPVTPLDALLVGTSRTRSSDSWVTDSAAGATAFSCAAKSYNGAIGVTDDQKPCGTVFEAAKLAGYKTGIIVTSRITHATPASFNSHVLWRDYENDIAEQQIGAGGLPASLSRATHLQLGGGRRHFVPRSDPESVREDDRDLLAEARSRGMRVLTTRRDFDALVSSSQLPAIGVFTPDHMSYNIDADRSVEPTLAEMTRKGLALLRNATLADPDAPGFMVMIEGSRIDMAAHSNDAGTHAHEILHYYKVVQAVREFMDAADPEIEEIAMVSTSDHETGGLDLARQVSPSYPTYQWFPAAVARQKSSTVMLAARMIAAGVLGSPVAVKDLVRKHLGVADLSPEELKFIADPTLTAPQLEQALALTVSVRAQLGWSTHGHTGVDVNLYAYGTDTELLRGNVENTDVGYFLQTYLNLTSSVESLTATLRSSFKFKHPDVPPPHDGPGLLGHHSEGASQQAQDEARRRAFGHS
ncbi:alkaline-phosphatase-like protein [Blastocladiella britannica]|nr:alkaline-phosphatase-like protein [Blastocladiella britannica]